MEQRSLAKLSIQPTDEDIVRVWLADRNLVAVSRPLMEGLAAVNNKEIMVGSFKIVYQPEYDRYIERQSSTRP